jgi:MFS family permease
LARHPESVIIRMGSALTGRIDNIVSSNDTAPHEPAASGTGSVLAVVGLGTLLSAMSGSAVNLALPDLGRDLGISLEASRWVLQSFLLAVAIALPFAGRASDTLGHRRVYLTGFGLFALMALACGLTRSLAFLVAARALQGVGGAMVMATGPALLTSTFPAARRGRALGTLATATYTGLTLGPTIGGLIVGAGGWRWTFFFNVPLSLFILLLAMRHLPRQGPVAAARSRGPFSDLELFRSRVFTGAALSALANYIAIFTVILLVPFFLMEGLGREASRAGMLLSAQPLVMALVAAPSGWLSDRLGSRGLATGGLLLQALGLFCLSHLGPGSSDLMVAGCLALVGFGTGVFISPNSSALMGAAPRDRQGAAGSALAEARIVGMLLGVVLGTTLFQLAGGRTGMAWRPEEFVALKVALRAATGVAVTGALVASMRGRRNGIGRG